MTIVQNNTTSLALLAAHSDARQQTAEALAKVWARLPHGDAPRRPRIVDFGAGDGEFLDRLLTRLPFTCEVMVVEPQDDLAQAAVRLLSSHGHHAVLTRDIGAVRDVDAYLAAHVLFYVPDAPDWLRQAARALSPQGAVTCVIRDPACDFFQLRKVVRDHYGLEPRVSVEMLSTAASELGLATDITPVISRFTYDVEDPVLAAVPDNSVDPALARFLCWVSGVPSHEHLPPDLRTAMNAFVMSRFHKGTLSFSQADAILNFTYREQARD